MGRVFEIDSKYDESDVSEFYDSKYLHHQGGKQHDEYVIYDEDRIIEYTIIVEQEAIEDYRYDVEKPYCNAIMCI